MATRVVVGVAGSGKTAQSMAIIEDELRNGLSWNQIGYCSFSRSACAEGAERAAKLTGESLDRIQRFGYFRTIHSSVLRCLGVDPKCILDHDSADGKKFLKEHIGSARGGERGSLGQKVDEVMSAWDFLRAHLALLAPDHRCEVPESHAADDTSQIAKAAQTPQLTEPDAGLMTPMTPDDRLMTGKSCALSSTQVNAAPHVKCSGDGSMTAFLSYTERKLFLSEQVSAAKNAVICHQQHLNPYRGKSCVDDTHFSSLSSTVIKMQNPSIFRFLKVLDRNADVITQYQKAKELYGRLDFTDLLLLFIGVKVEETLEFTRVKPLGEIPAEVEVWLIDEAQDCSNLLWRAAQRLSDCARDVFWLGDAYQSVYGFSGACAQNFEAAEMEAEQSGNRLLLNRSWRNPDTVLEWGEAVLRESGDYRERSPFGEAGEGSVGLVDEEELMGSIADLAATDTMVIARTWFALENVIRRLNESGIPWRSTSEERSSRWECPAKIAYTLVMRELMAGIEISEQDWRRVTETLPVKQDGIVLFERGAKAKWKKAECSRQPEMRLDGIMAWGATPEFVEWVRHGKWRKDMPLLLDHAIERFGIDEVRKPSVRVGTVHSVKGLEAANVFCLAGSTDRVVKEGDPREETCLKYVAITRASQNYRLVVNRLDMQRGKPLFWSAPKGANEWVGMPEMERARISKTGECDPLGGDAGLDMDCEDSRRSLHEDWVTGPDSVNYGPVHSDRDEMPEKRAGADADLPNEEDSEEWWNL